MALGRPTSPILERPAPLRRVIGSLLLGLLLNLVPWPENVVIMVPDVLALMLIFWVIHQPNRVGLTVCFVLGLLMDVANASVLGQYALAYTTLGFLALSFRRRILQFAGWQQALFVLILLLLLQAMILLVNLAAGRSFPGLEFFAAAPIGAALWPSLSFFLRQQRPLSSLKGA